MNERDNIIEENVYDAVVIGGGPAGLAAAIAAKQNGLRKVLVLERDKRAGGILLQCIHNGFGLHYFGEELTGPEYALRFVSQAESLGVLIKTNTMVLEIKRGDPRQGTLHEVVAISAAEGLCRLQARSIVLAMGCRERTRGALVIPGTRPAGIFTAGSAQRFVNIDGYLPGRKVVILGSGDIGLIMARRLTLEGAEVKLVCEIMGYSAGLARNMTQCLENFNIPLRLSTTIIQIHGSERVSGVTIAQVDGQRKPIAGTEEFIPCDTVLLSVGLIPENEVSIAAGVAIDGITKGPSVTQRMETSVPGIFACGNSVHVHDLVDYVTVESLLAGKCAAQYVHAAALPEKALSPVPVMPGNRVRYVVPQQLDLSSVSVSSAEESVMLMFRSTDVYRAVHVVVYAGARAIAHQNKRIVRPGEMQTITLKAKELACLKEGGQALTVSIELPEDLID